MLTRTGKLALGRPLVVGILNRTPDSFSDGGELDHLAVAVDAAATLVADGADMLDIGGESTRPGAVSISPEEEMDRVLPLIAAVNARFDVPLSVDTRRAAVAREALEAGACVVNDVSGFGDPEMGEVCAVTGAGWVLMHMPHAMGEMQWSTRDHTLAQGVAAGLDAVAASLAAIVARAEAAGVKRAQLALDPGLGFGKSTAQNFGFLRDFGAIAKLGLPLYVGPSRKSFIGRVTGEPAQRRQFGTAACVTAAVLAGADFVRVHDVRQMRRVVDVAIAIKTSS